MDDNMITLETSIPGTFTGTAADLIGQFKLHNQDTIRATRLAPLYITWGKYFNIRADLAWGQMEHETAYLKFGGLVKAGQNNFAGIGATGPGHPGNSFATEELGVIAQFAHLAWYVYPEHVNDFCSAKYDPRHFTWKAKPHRNAGTAIKILSETWAVGAGGYIYANAIIKLANEIKPISVEPPPQTPGSYELTIQMGHLGYNGGMTGARGEQAFNHLLGDALSAKFIDTEYRIKLMGTYDFGLAKPLKTHLFFSIHGDGSINPAAHGCSIGYPVPSNPAFAKAIQDAYIKLSGFYKRADNYTAGLQRYYAWGRGYVSANYYCLLEHGFCSNVKDYSWMMSHIEQIAECHYQTIKKFL